jgi:hypothetical protein
MTPSGLADPMDDVESGASDRRHKSLLHEL